MSTHTEGPWRVVSTTYRADDGMGRCDIHAEGVEGVAFDALPRDARLIAAAPELLRMARMYRDECAGAASMLESGEMSGLHLSAHDYREQIAYIESVIASATEAQVSA